jgi:NAD(P)-dependent dehydrogenase (short-subunit alcohol dehydrogenase family)
MAKRKQPPTKASGGFSPARLAGKYAVVIGGNRGIGLAIACALVREGCSVLVTGRDRAALRAAKAGLAADCAASAEALADVCDVREEKSVAAVFAKVKKRWGRLDVLVNNAGISQARFPLTGTPVELWRSVIDINLTGTFLCCRAGVPLMPAGSTVVNMLSIAAKQNFPEFSAYNASKRGALGLTLTLREELIPRGIRVVALMPGATATDIWEQFWPEAPREKMVTPESVADAVIYAATLPPQANLSVLELVPLQGVL